MYVCICNAVTDHAIREAAAGGVRTVAELRQRTGCGDCCGSCEEFASEVLHDTLRAQALDLPTFAVAAAA